MNSQNELFHEDWRDALAHLVKALGGYETVGIEIYPNKNRRAAGNWLSDCLNPERDAKLHLDDIQALLRMGRENGVHCAIHKICEEAGYEAPKPAAPKSKRAQLLERDAALAEERARIARDLDRLESAAVLKSVDAK